jgi:CDP-diacylglycerol---glycerol-3-phosphate 3-phosphatidyltransferase
MGTLPGMPVAWWHALPNAITSARFVLSVVCLVALARAGALEGPQRSMVGSWAITIFIVAALTDILDGYLARRWNAITPFGRVMDPFVDKVLVLGTFVFLASPGLGGGDGPSSGVAAWMVVVMLARELLVTSLRGVLEGMGRPFPADRFGKAKMLLQCVAAPIAINRATHGWFAPAEAGMTIAHWTLWAAVVATALSGLPSLLRAAALLQARQAR